MIITLKTYDKAQSMSILRYLKEHGATYSTHIEAGIHFNDAYVIDIDDDDHSKNVVCDFLNLR